ncbi:MAG: hypothetical protein ACXW3E_06110 [Thermoanaerobaculia bacterium]
MGNARPSVTKKQREQKKRERQAVKAEKRAQRKTAAHEGTPIDDQIEWPVADQAEPEVKPGQ